MYYGVDACQGGWCVAKLRRLKGKPEDGAPEDDGTPAELEVLPSFAEVARRALEGGAEVVFVDMPIGLPDGRKVRRRVCDSLARRTLGRQSSSVFPVPVRPALEARTYEEASRVQQEVAGGRLSRQSWGLAAKILEVDRTLREDPLTARLAPRVYESHPELCFLRLNGGQPVEWSKRSAAGVLARARLLRPYLGDVWAFISEQRAGLEAAAIDDVLDALVLAVHARLAPERGMLSLPPQPEIDVGGLPMRIVTADLGGPLTS
ncbi:MAG: DUF429 domain-containing protein [Firmicutes bacterium]|nr:DUF429 domain-containing protein [Bacillota bacterium]